MTYFTIELQNQGAELSYAYIYNEHAKQMFGGCTFDEFQTRLIKIVTHEKVNAVVRNRKGNEIMTMFYSPNSEEGVACGWSSNRRINSFINSFNA